MPWPAVMALQKHWKKYPPVHILVASYFGFGKDTEEESSAVEDSMFYGDPKPLESLPPDIQKFILENRKG